jgi:predicted anti-sigma-YlaC factor YlaD
MTQHLSLETLIDYIHGELTPEADAAVHLHLTSCPACREEYDAEVQVGEALRAVLRAQDIEFPSIVAARTWERIRNARTGPLASLAILLRPVVAVPLVLAIGFGAYFATPLGHAPKHDRTINASYYLEQHAGQEAADPLAERGPVQVMESSLVDTAPAAGANDALH